MKFTPLATLAVFNLVFASGLAFLWHDAAHVRWAEPTPVPPALDNDLPTEKPQPAEIARYRETIERPLFVASRRPAPPPSAEGESRQDADPAKDLRLLGLYALGNRGGAIVEHGGKIQRVPFGQKIGGWTVAGAAGQRASIVRGNGEKRELQVALVNTPLPAAATAASSADASARAVQSSAAGGVQPSSATRDTRRQASRAEGYRRRLEELKARRAADGSNRTAPTNMTPEKTQ